MTIKKLQLDLEIKILIYLIVNDRFITEIFPIIRSSYFKTSYSKLICTWCLEYYEQYKKAPKEDIQSIYKIKRSTIDDSDDDTDNIKLFLSNLSKQWESYLEPTNIDFIITEAINYLNIRSLEILKEQIEVSLEDNDYTKGQQFISNYKRVEKPSGQGIDLLKDTKKIINAFTIENDTLITFPGDLGKIIQPINRGDFISYFGPAARGKSFWLWYTTELGIKNGYKVIYITLEMTENEIIRRAWPSLTGRPKTNDTIKYAVFEENNGKYDIQQKEEYKEGVNLETIEQFQNKLKRLFRKGNVKIICPTDKIDVLWIESTLDNLYHYDNYIPDIIVIDYADMMVPERGFKVVEYRHKLDNIWKGLRALALKKNIAIVTASHTEAKTFDSDIKVSNASEDKRKMNHVTMGIALNQTEKEQENNIMRLKLLKTRESRKSSNQVVVTQCLDLGRPCIDSKLINIVNLGNIEEKYEKHRKKKID